jgi:transposase
LSNQEIKLAKAHNAVIVREDLTVEALEKDAPEYKGRRFNKMINNGSKGQYQNKASDKMIWNGVLEIIIGSWYTSRYCGKHGVIIEKRHRQGEKLFVPCCNKHDHADLHASETIASALFLRPKQVTLA